VGVARAFGVEMPSFGAPALNGGALPELLA
jgi:hypothetical protein